MNAKPVYLMAGGMSHNKHMNAVLQAVYRTSGKDSPNIAYIGTASGDNKIFFNLIKLMLKKAGAGKIDMPSIARRNANIEKARALISAADAVFVSGGDVEAGMLVLEQKGMKEFLRELYHKGKVFFGASAGSIMLAKEWVRWRVPDDDSSAEIFPCLGVAPVLCDTHDEKGGWEELQALLELEKPGTRGFGIASDTCLVVYPDGKLEAMGGPVWHFSKQGNKVVRNVDIVPS